MNRWLLILVLLPACSIAQTPTLVQSVWAENSGATAAGAGWSNPCVSGGTTIAYCVSFPEATLSGNLLTCETFGAATSTYSISDDQSQTWTKVNSSNFPFTSASSNVYNFWYVVNNAGGTRRIKINSTASNTGFLDVKCQEFYNVATTSPVDGTANCHTVTSTTATGVTTGTLTSGDLIVMSTDNDNASAIASFTAGSQTNITWALLAGDRLEGYAVQYGVYTTTTAFTPQMTTGTSQPFTSCQAAFKAASAGTAPSQTFRIVHEGHFALPGSTTTRTFQMPATGNLLIISFTAGGDCIATTTGATACATTATTTGLSDAGSNTWKCTGTVVGGSATTASSQICYAGNATLAATETVSISRYLNGLGSLSQDTAVIYDVTGAATSPFDNDSGGQTASQGSIVSSLTTCSSCFSPGTTNDLVIVNANWNFGTATTATAPSTCEFDSAVTNFNDVNGPEPVDQNGGWCHYYTPSTSSISVTWTLANDGTNPPGSWVGRVAAFKTAAVATTQIHHSVRSE
jgi:hypothetical protein